MEEKIFSPEAMGKLEPYRGLFEMFDRSKYVRYPGSAALTEIHRVYTTETGDTSIRLNTNCQRCMTDLFSAVTPIYLRTLRNVPQSTHGNGDEKTPAPQKKTRQKRNSTKITN